MNWLDNIDNRRSFESLYNNPPSLNNILIVKLDYCAARCTISFILDQLPDITPRNSIWASKESVLGVFVSINFLVLNIQPPHFPKVMEKYDLCISSNSEYVETILYDKNKYPYWAKDYPLWTNSDRILIRIKNNISIYTYKTNWIRVLQLRPIFESISNIDNKHYNKRKYLLSESPLLKRACQHNNKIIQDNHLSNTSLITNKTKPFCQVCGLFYPDDFNIYPKDEYCNCCGEYYDDIKNKLLIAQLRKQWLENNAKWKNEFQKPKNWNIQKQLENIIASDEVKQLLKQYPTLTENEC
jgi:hypothetical protein